MPGKLVLMLAAAGLSGGFVMGAPDGLAAPAPIGDALHRNASTYTGHPIEPVFHRRVCARWVWTRSRPPRRVCIRWISPPHLIERERIRPPIPDPGPLRRRHPR